MTLSLRLCLEDAAQRCGLAPERVLYFISEHWVQPADPESRYFDEEDVARMSLIHELQQHFGVNDEAVPLILHLVDQLNRLHRELKAL